MTQSVHAMKSCLLSERLTDRSDCDLKGHSCGTASKQNMSITVLECDLKREHAPAIEMHWCEP
jgi:hypothetical protein